MRYFYLLIFSCFALFKLDAQVDTSFWFVAPDVPPTFTNNPIELNFSSYSQPTSIRVRQPANAGGVDLTFTLAANSTTVVNLTASITAVLSAPANTVSNKGLYISSTQKISAYFSIGSVNNKEMLTLKGTRAVGTDFYTPFPTTLPTLTTVATVGDVSFDVVATQTGVTTILITPRANCVAHPKDITFSRNLNFGETFSTRDLGTISPSQMAGSIISADKKIAVTISGATGNSTVCPSFYADQITNSSELGKAYVIHNGNSTENLAYILAPVNSTSLTVTTATGVANWLINSGETFSVNTTGANLSFIEADKPIYVFHVSGFGCKLGGAQVTPAYCAGSYSTAFTRLSSDSLFLDTYIRTGFQGGFTLTVNNATVPILASSFSAVPGSAGNLVGARNFYSITDIPVGSHIVLRNNLDVFGNALHNGSTSGGVGYGYTTEFGTSSFVYANSVPTATICSNTSFTLNGQVGGGPIAGFWTTNGYGTFSGGPNQLTNNVYTPHPLDTSILPTPTVIGWTGGQVKIVLTSVGFCPNKSDTLKLRVLQGPIVNAGSDQIKCTNNSSVQLSGTILGASSQGTWNPLPPSTGGTLTNAASLTTEYYPSSTDTALAFIKILLTSINNGICASANDTVKITFQKAPIVKAALTPTLVRCSNNSTVSLNGYITSPIVSGIWSSSGTGIFVPNNISLINNYIPSSQDIINGSVKLKLTTPPNALCKPVSDSVMVFFTNPAAITAGVDLNSCKNNPFIALNAVITGTTTNSGIWAGGSGTFVPNNTTMATTYIATPAEANAGFVILTVSTTASGICAETFDQIRIDFRDKPTANFIFNNVCLNQATQYTDQSINTSGLGALNTWLWDFGNGETSTNTDPSLTYTTAGSYTAQLIVSNTFNCYDTIERTITVYPLPLVKLSYARICTGSSQRICFTDSSTVDAPSTLPSTGYYWDFGGVGFSVTKDTCFVFPTEGKYSVTHQVTSSNGCLSTLIQTINITPKPKAKFLFINSSALSLGANIQFIDSSANSVGWFWDFGNGLTSLGQNPSSSYSENGSYTVTQTVNDQFGCTDTYTNIVVVRYIVNDVVQLIPNVISPNNDGKNDYWRLDFIDIYYPEAEIEIFNRWGESIFRSKGYSNAWDGSYKGDALPVGAYYYTLDLKDPNKPGIIKGNITLLK